MEPMPGIRRREFVSLFSGAAARGGAHLNTQLIFEERKRHASRHLTDGNIDLALMVYDSEDVEEAQLSGPGPCIHHWGIEVEDRDSYVAKIEANGGTIISEPSEGALKFRAPDGTVAEIVGAGRYNKKKAEKAPA